MKDKTNTKKKGRKQKRIEWCKDLTEKVRLCPRLASFDGARRS